MVILEVNICTIYIYNMDILMVLLSSLAVEFQSLTPWKADQLEEPVIPAATWEDSPEDEQVCCA